MGYKQGLDNKHIQAKVVSKQHPVTIKKFFACLERKVMLTDGRYCSRLQVLMRFIGQSPTWQLFGNATIKTNAEDGKGVTQKH